MPTSRYFDRRQTPKRSRRKVVAGVICLLGTIYLTDLTVRSFSGHAFPWRSLPLPLGALLLAASFCLLLANRQHYALLALGMTSLLILLFLAVSYFASAGRMGIGGCQCSYSYDETGALTGADFRSAGQKPPVPHLLALTTLFAVFLLAGQPARSLFPWPMAKLVIGTFVAMILVHEVVPLGARVEFRTESSSEVQPLREIQSPLNHVRHLAVIAFLVAAACQVAVTTGRAIVPSSDRSVRSLFPPWLSVAVAFAFVAMVAIHLALPGYVALPYALPPHYELGAIVVPVSKYYLRNASMILFVLASGTQVLLLAVRGARSAKTI